jgi:hypothetical protein
MNLIYDVITNFCCMLKPRNKTKKCTLESNVGLFCVLMCLYTCNIFIPNRMWKHARS